MAKTPPSKPTVKKRVPAVKTHALEPVVRELVAAVDKISDTLVKVGLTNTAADLVETVKETEAVGDLPPLPPPDSEVSPPPLDPITPPPEPPCCCDQEFCDFLKNGQKPLVECYPAWDPTKPAGSRWSWKPE